jgi:hypothetical protein
VLVLPVVGTLILPELKRLPNEVVGCILEDVVLPKLGTLARELLLLEVNGTKVVVEVTPRGDPAELLRGKFP